MLKTSLHFASRGLNHLTRVTLVSAALFIFVVALLVLGLRYWLLPNIEHFHDAITASASQSIGQPLSIGKIEAEWDGLRPHLMLSDVRILDPDNPGVTALELRHVDGVVSWRGMLLGELRLHTLQIDKPDLFIRRDIQGHIYVAGVPLTQHPADKNGLADWLLHQSYIAVRDARITWLDELRAAPPLVFDHLEVFVDNKGQHHRFAAHALPPPELSAQLDVRGDFYGKSFDHLETWRGQIYTQFNYVDVAAWRAWLQLPDGFDSGKGALRAWLGVDEGKLIEVTSDVSLAGVRAQLQPTLPALDMQTLNGRIAWRDVAHGFEVSTRGLALQMRNGVTLPPTDFFLRLVEANGTQPAEGEIRANALQLANMVSLSDVLPLDPGIKKQLTEFAPQGQVENLQATWHSTADKVQSYQLKARFSDLAMKRTAHLPGFSGLSGTVEGNDNSGKLTLDAHKLTLDAPQFMPEALAFDSLAGNLEWKSGQHGPEVKFSEVKAVNADLSGSMSGGYQPLGNGLGIIDLNIDLTRAAVNRATRYIPLEALGKETSSWLHTALLNGQADLFRLRLRGNINDFPFVNGQPGEFRIEARTRGIELAFDKAWPRISNGNGDLLIVGKRLEVKSSAADLSGVHMQDTSVVIPDIMSNDMLLQIRGEGKCETSRCLEFIQKSPIQDYIDGFTDDMMANGSGSLRLKADIPLNDSKSASIAGSYTFSNNDLKIDDGVPMLRKLNGELQFTETSFSTRNMTAQLFGGPVTISVQSGKGGVIQANLGGHADMDILRQSVPDAVLTHLRGGADWNAEIKAQKKQANMVLTTNLVGLSSDLPAPFTKTAEEAIPLQFEMKNTSPRSDLLTLQVGKLLNAKFARRLRNGEWVVRRGTVNFGGIAKIPSSEGVWLSGTIPQLSLQGWDELGGTSSGGAPSFTVGGADLLIRKLDAYGHGVNNLRVSARNQNGALTAQLAAKEINGEVSWLGEGKGKLVAHLKNLTLGGDSFKPEDTLPKSTSVAATSSEFPALDLTVDELSWKDKQLGHMELQAQQRGKEWQMERMRITNAEGVLNAEGKYLMAAGIAQTQVKLKLEISDAGKLLARSGYPDTVKGGSGKLEGELSWRGGPEDFSYAGLEGTLNLDAEKGQFLKIEPGIGKLLGILSLQALPRHITLDFTDVFSDGFQFDSVTGNARIKQGVMTTDDFKLDGSSAKVTMQGQVDLDHETQDLRVRVMPAVGNGVSLLGAFAAGPVVGLGTFLANKLLRDPLDKIVSFEYNVTGTWLNPNVVKVNRAAGTTSNAASDN